MILQKIKNIRSVAKYESKLLVRSWFFKIFAFIIFAVSLILFAAMSSNGNFTLINILKDAPSLIPYYLILYLNIGQSVVLIFLSADYLKRDKQLDTSEVFYVKPLSNSDYLIGKMCGTIRPFLNLNIVLLALIWGLSNFVLKIDCSIINFINYYLIVVLPSLLFFIGLSTAVTLLVGNQAISYLVLLGFVILSIMYIGEYFGGIFDVFILDIPLYNSPIMGFSNLDTVLNQRVIYLLVGIGAIILSISLFKRLAGSKKAELGWMGFSIAIFISSIFFIIGYCGNVANSEKERESVISLNSKYVDYPRLLIDNYYLDIEQHPYSLSSNVKVVGTVSKDANELIFTLNSGMNVNSVTTIDSLPLNFKREKHLVIVELGETLQGGDSLALNFKYSGYINENELYADIADDLRKEKNRAQRGLFFMDKKSAFIEPEWVLLTPESNWYVKAGVTYTDATPNWRTDYFSNYSVDIKPLSGMLPVTQGQPTMLADSLTYNFTPNEPLRAISLAISDYKRYSIDVDSIDYAVYINKGNLHKISMLDSLKDTIPSIIRNMKGYFERSSGIKYDLPRFTLVDAPTQLHSYPRVWSTTQELAQPEILFIPGGGTTIESFNFGANIESEKFYMKNGWTQVKSDNALMADILFRIAYHFATKDITTDYSFIGGGGYKMNEKSNPHSLSSVLFNSKYNIISDSLSWGNQLIEFYYTSYDNLIQKDAGKRNVNGMSDMEQVLLLLKDNGYGEYFGNAEYSSFVNEIILAQGNRLFAESMSKMGAEEFMDLLKRLVDSSLYKNINIKTIFDSISVKSNCDVSKNIEFINKPIKLSAFNVGSVKITQGVVDGETTYSAEVIISNVSDNKGYIDLSFNLGGSISKYIIELEGNQTKRVVKHLASRPNRVIANTMNSSNIPHLIYPSMSGGAVAMLVMGGANAPQRRPRSRATDVELVPEGEYILDDYSLLEENEIIVDNEDSELFSVSAPPKSGYLNSWIYKSGANDVKYKGMSGRAPYKWTLVSGNKYYGTDVLSGLFIKKGDGSQFVTWKIPVSSGSKYSLQFATVFPQDMNRGGGRGGRGGVGRNQFTYDFTIDLGDKVENVTYDFRNMRRTAAYSWEWLGDFTATTDTIAISLSNKSNLYTINADAVKAVKLD